MTEEKTPGELDFTRTCCRTLARTERCDEDFETRLRALERLSG